MHIDGDFFVVGERRFPIYSRVIDDTIVPETTFDEHWPMRIRNVHLRFESGYTLSISFGSMTYSTNKNAFALGWPSPIEWTDDPHMVEVAVFHKDHESLGQWPDEDTVQGYVKAERLLAIIEGCEDGSVPVIFDDDKNSIANIMKRLNVPHHDQGES